MLYTIILLIEFICLVIAYTNLPKHTNWRKFVWFLYLIVAIEITGYITYFIFHQKNHWVYNIYLLISTPSYCIILSYMCKPFFKANLIIFLGFLVFSGLFLYETFTVGFLQYANMSSNFNAVFFMIICCLFYHFLLKSDGYINLSIYPPFWIITGMFFFHFGSTGCNLFAKYLIQLNQKMHTPLRYSIFIILNFILYSCWSYAFICKKKQTILYN
jgi:hypothetical protein